jgi:hypothetical protein
LTGRNGQEWESYSQIEQQTTGTSGVWSQPPIVETIPIPLREGNARIGPTNLACRRIEGKELQVYSRRPRIEIQGEKQPVAEQGEQLQQAVEQGSRSSQMSSSRMQNKELMKCKGCSKISHKIQLAMVVR